ncbi:mRNA capping enzyme, catalytic domain-containing protein [Papiliotrema laurentii]|uniref:mRNA-capping enzyme subunit alpha n=1 Tax=Papiliotrema laurentii TaxID=5418 RepID=A0AAD9FRE0_PAPLA|nr:mRNA capping enzyme, catalytic domain-containing protein [Papiliotrema laurentii]
MPHPIPEIPGELLEDSHTAQYLSERVAGLCGLRGTRFPGSQPVSFTSSSLSLLERKDFWVCEKSDGVRVLVYILMNENTNHQDVWLIDRKQRYFKVEALHFPHWERTDQPLRDTILDGELVLDIDPKTHEETLRFYAFDCLVLNGENIMAKSLLSRFGRLRNWVVGPFQKALKAFPEWRASAPFEVLAKEQELSYHIAQVLNVHIPQLQHGHDGLIFTCAESSYVPGTDENILKWKPPSENSIDFKLQLRFPPSPHDPSQPDFYAKPVGLLYTWLGRDDYEFFDEMELDDDEWKAWKESGEQFDDRIIEVSWDNDRSTWKYLRIRDDKPHANHKNIMKKIMVSITDGVEIEALLERSDAIRTAWKNREAVRNGKAPPAPEQRRPGGMPLTPAASGGRTAMPPTPGGYGATSQPAGSSVVAGLRR